MTNQLLELYDVPAQQFKLHLDDNENERIVFSGKFGAGKTSFLKHFFSSEGQKDYLNSEKYHVIHIFPVNYSISNNEDIIKFKIRCSF